MEARKSYRLGECQDGHKALVFMDELGNQGEVFRCICLECGEFYTLKASDKSKVKNLIIPNGSFDFIDGFENIKQNYLREIFRGKTSEEAVSEVNKAYAKQKKTIVR